MPDPGNQYLWHLTPKNYDIDVIELDLQMQERLKISFTSKMFYFKGYIVHGYGGSNNPFAFKAYILYDILQFNRRMILLER